MEKECSTEDHAAIARDPLRFRRELKPAGHQDDGAGGQFQFGTCGRCGSTLALDRNVIDLAVRLRDALAALCAGDVEAALHETVKAGEFGRRVEARREYDALEARELERRARLGLVAA